MQPAILLWMWIFAAAQTATSTDLNRQIRVGNGGFEQGGDAGRVPGWHLETESARDQFQVRRSMDAAHSGEASLAIDHSAPGSTVVRSDTVELRVGRVYRLSGWIRTQGVVSDPVARYPTSVPACLSMESFPFTNHSAAVGADSDWTHVQTLFVATRSKDRVRLHLGHNGAAAGKVWFDDVALEEVEDISEFIPMETVRWFREGYRYDDRGWIFVHVEGEPFERGYQYGTLLADEIVAYMSKLAIQSNGSDPAAGWQMLRFECDALFLRGYDPEYLTEMKGIAEGAANAGAKYDHRPLDLLDIVTINSFIDLDQLRDAMQVTPHALTGESFLSATEEMRIAEKNHKCSAFAATGPATADGQVVFGQIFMWSGYTGVHWNVICDLQPTSGHRLVYHTFPGGIHSGADFYVNSAGIVIGETTVAQTPFKADSTPQSNRIRKAAQYASSIDDVERILWEKNNGMYTNDWPIADIKTGEVAILLLGTNRKKLWRTGEDMAPFGTPGFLWANNNNRDMEVRKEYLAQPEDRPFDLIFNPWNRDVAFNDFYRKYKGNIDSNVAVKMWASSPINRAHACDGKITTTEMARELAFLAHYGKVTLREKFTRKGERIMPDLPEAIPHLSLGYSVASPIYVTDKVREARDAGMWKSPPEKKKVSFELGELASDFEIPKEQLWRRTVYPAAEADNWFVSASAAYWRILADLDKDKSDSANANEPGPVEKLSKELAGLNRRYLYTVSREADLPAIAAERAYDRYGPYVIPRIKGTFALHQLRLLIGTNQFLKLMRSVHERFSERELSTEQFLRAVEEHSDSAAARLVRQWIEREGLPQLVPSVDVRPSEEGRWEVRLSVTQSGEPYRVFMHLLVETEKARQLRRVEVEGRQTDATYIVDERPLRIEFNALGDVPTANPNFYVWPNLIDDFHQSLIVYGTARQDEANHTLARRWQETVADAYIEILPPLVKDSELTASRAADHDLIVIGTLNDNRFFQDNVSGLPIRFGQNHFEWRGETFGHPDDGLFLVVPNPFNAKRVMYIIAANSALELFQMTKKYPREIPSWAVFRGEKIVDQGFHPVSDFQFDGPFGPS